MGEIPSIFRIHGDNIGEVLFSTHVAGTTFVRGSERVLKYLKEEVDPKYIRVYFLREPKNKYDKNAVQVLVSIKGSKKKARLGYVPKDRSEVLSYALDNSDKYTVIAFNPVLVGGDKEKPNIGLFYDYRILDTEKLKNGDYSSR